MSSEVWKHFTISDTNSSIAVCKYCKASISRGGKSHSTSAMKKHVRKHCLQIFAAKNNEEGESDLPELSSLDSNAEETMHSASSSFSVVIDSPSCDLSPNYPLPKRKNSGPSQLTLQSFMEKKRKFKPGDQRSKEITRLIAEMVCLDNQPLSVVENKGFQALVLHLEPRYTMASRKHIGNKLIPEMYDETKTKVRAILSKAEGISITTDMWTSTSNDDYLSITAHFIDADFKSHHLCLEVVPFPEVSHTGQNLRVFICETLKSWDIADKIFLIVRDNGRNICCALNESDFSHIPCLAHTLQLVVKDGLLNSKMVSGLIATCRRVVGHFKHSSKATKVLKKAQVTVGVKQHRLMQDEPTRWNSSLHMLTRLLEQKAAVTLAATYLTVPVELTSHQWEQIVSVAGIANIFNQATFAVSSADVTISEIIPIINSAMHELKKPAPVSSGLQGVKNDLLTALKCQYRSVESNEFYAVATLLDPRFKGSVFQSEELLQQAKTQLIQEVKSISGTHPEERRELAPTSDGKTSMHGMWSFYSHIMSSLQTSNHSDTAEEEVERYLREELLPPDNNVLEYWKSVVHQFSVLPKLARKYLSAPPATVQSERLFSTAGIICDKKRNRLDPERAVEEDPEPRGMPSGMPSPWNILQALISFRRGADGSSRVGASANTTSRPAGGHYGGEGHMGTGDWLPSLEEHVTMLPTAISFQAFRRINFNCRSLNNTRKSLALNDNVEEVVDIALSGNKNEIVCHIADSPFRILRAAESGDLEEFGRLYFAEPARLRVQDSRGRSAAHQAAARNKSQILQFIATHRGDLNIQDQAGNTPLHIAIEHDALEVVDYLLQCNVDTSIINDKKQAPLHLATELNKLSVLQVMVRHKDKFNIQLGGDHGRTALHLAAIYDHDECARILIKEFGATPRCPCNNGYYPIHEAAKNASSRTMEVFLQWGESRGCTREEMISFYDAEGNVPLHSAVHGGDIKAVELCLRSGAKISKQQHDLSTPVHLACAQGALEIVRLMFSMQPKEKVPCLASCDAQKMTPLHCAAMFDHPEIVEYLVKEGADINALDKEKRSALLLAASRGAWRTVHTLIQLGADIRLRDDNLRNTLHLIVMNGGRLEEFAHRVSQGQTGAGLCQLLNEKDISGCSPLHYASREGHIRSLENLIRLGACINLKNNNNESPLHFAARYGRYNSVRQLLDSEKGTFIINESDGEGLTPLHIASQQGHTRVVQLLLNRGALLHRDHNGRNPLHLAAMSGYTQTMELLHSVHSHLLDQVDKDGNTALHLATMENKPSAISLLLYMGCKLLYNTKGLSAIDYAIYYKFPEAALAMVTHEERGPEVLALRSDKHPCVVLALIASMPRVFEAVQDKGITKANCKKDSKSFYIRYNFKCLQHLHHTAVDHKSEDGFITTKPTPLPALNAMVAHGRVELLAHPLSQKYLQMKWNSYGKYFHLANLLFYTIFLAFIISFTACLLDIHPRYKGKCRSNDFEPENCTSDFNSSASYQGENPKPPMMYFSGIAILTYILLNILREAIQAYQQKWQYLLDPFNVVSLLLYASAFSMVFPMFGTGLGELQYSCAATTIFLSCFNLLLYLQRFDQVGIYIVMFLEILQTLIKVLLIFSILIIAFGLSFYILLLPINNLSFQNVPMSLMRTFSMMLGEIDFIGTFVHSYYQVNEEKSLRYPILTFLILGIFMVFMPILLMNLLIGLAVGDIESVRRNAQLKRLAMQVVLHTELERKLPHMLLEKVDKLEIIEYPNHVEGKRGFLDSFLKKWFGSPFSEDGLEVMLENSEDYLPEELEKQKRRLKEMHTSLEMQHQLLRLIVQKMEIKTEADDIDEGVSPNDLIRSSLSSCSKWTSPKMRKKLRCALSFTKGHST